MSIFSRLTDIINSNINSMLDKAEDPEKIIRMIVQEMEDTLVEVRSSAARTIADQKDVERQLGRLEKAQSDWEAKAELAISKGREDLAKGALIEKSKLADAAEHMAAELEHLKTALSSHEDDVIKLEAKLREARAKKKALAGRQTTAQNRLKVNRNLHDGRIDNAFERFDKVEQRIDRIESEIESYDLGDGATLEDAIAGLETDEAIEKELEALKVRVSGAKSSGKAKDGGAKDDKAEAAE